MVCPILLDEQVLPLERSPLPTPLSPRVTKEVDGEAQREVVRVGVLHIGLSGLQQLRGEDEVLLTLPLRDAELKEEASYPALCPSNGFLCIVNPGAESLGGWRRGLHLLLVNNVHHVRVLRPTILTLLQGDSSVLPLLDSSDEIAQEPPDALVRFSPRTIEVDEPRCGECNQSTQKGECRTGANLKEVRDAIDRPLDPLGLLHDQGTSNYAA